MKVITLVKKGWFLVVIVIVLITFFFPKPSDKGGRSIGNFFEWNEQKCSCLGFEKDFSIPDVGADYLCFGIPLACKCTKNALVREGQVITTNINC